MTMQMLLARRRMMMMQSASPVLPSGYTQLQYIESSGEGQCLNLGISGNADFEMTAQSSVVTTSNKVLLCSSTTGVGGTYFGSLSSGNWGAGVTADTGILGTTKADITLSFTSTGVSGTVNGTSFSRTEYVNHNVFGLFATIYGMFPFSGKVWFLKGYQNGILIIHLIPAIRDLDQEVGMYDIVRHRFFTSAGSGTFTYGLLP